jgi:hypothetical protein
LYDCGAVDETVLARCSNEAIVVSTRMSSSSDTPVSGIF